MVSALRLLHLLQCCSSPNRLHEVKLKLYIYIYINIYIDIDIGGGMWTTFSRTATLQRCNSANVFLYLIVSTMMDLAGILTVNTPFFSWASLKSTGATTLGCWKSL